MDKHIGTIVTVYTTSGGESGFGFTGVLSMITPCFVRLIICSGPAPCCPPGSSCNSPMYPYYYGGRRRAGGNSVFAGGYRNAPINNAGSIADIPLDKIAAFVHNAV
jgi:hypothetical protein